jgi:hypothetical protein
VDALNNIMEKSRSKIVEFKLRPLVFIKLGVNGTRRLRK